MAQIKLIRIPGLVLIPALAALAAGCGGGGAGPSATPDVSSPTPFIADIDLDLAAKLLAQGDSEEALAIYAAGAERGTEEEQRESLWTLARTYSRQGDNSAAEEAIETLQDTGLKPGEEGAALLLQGKAEFAQGDFDEAKNAFDEYLEAGGPSAPYAMLYLSQISHQQGDETDAIDHLTEALAADLPDAVVSESLLTLANLQEEAGQPDDALATLERAVESAPSANEVAEALWLLAETAERHGNHALATETLQTLVSEYPASYRSLEALALPSAEFATRDRAMVLFRNRVNGEAETAFISISDQGGDGYAEAQYHLGVLSERYERWDDAIIHYDAAIDSGQSQWYAAQATWDKATVLERLGRTDEAIAAYASVADVMPAHAQAGPGGFRAGLMSYQLGLPGDALTYWDRFLAVAPNAEEKARANFWLAKTSEAFGDTITAEASYQAAIEADPSDFYAFRSRSILAGETPPAHGVEPSPASASDWRAVEEWLTQTYGPEDAIANDALFAGDQYRRSKELLTAGMDDRADVELRDLLADNENDPWLTYHLARELDSMGRYWLSSPAARSLLSPDAPAALLQLVYPLPYSDLVQQEAEANGFPPLLFLALIRQESLYQPDVVSSAEAIGLTQVIPDTADAIALEIGAEEFRYADLRRPRVSLEFGAHYLGGVLEGFDGLIPVALSAYNGGPGNAGRWWDASGGDIDLFVETIDYPETRAYVELVMENYALYLFAYGITAEPRLPN